MADRFESLDKVLVIIPTYNEADNIEPITKRVHESVADAQILIVDDNSPDGTGELADNLAQANPKISVLHRAAKAGLAAAYLAGFRWGLENGYEVLVELDADGSHEPELLPVMLAAMREKDADMVKGSRWVKGGTTDQSKIRELLSRAANIWVQMWMDLPTRDATGGFNLFRASMLRMIGLENIESRGYTFQVDMTRRVLAAGGVVIEVPIHFPDRMEGESKMSSAIILEALAKTAAWGLETRINQVKSIGETISGKLQAELEPQD